MKRADAKTSRKGRATSPGVSEQLFAPRSHPPGRSYTHPALGKAAGILGSVSDACECIALLDALDDACRQASSTDWLKAYVLDYSYASKLYENGRWFMHDQRMMAPGTVCLGVVLTKCLEVSVVECLGGQMEYHRPMAVLSAGSVFGAFECADFFSRSLPIQQYTVFAGIRTFFFSNPDLDIISAQATFKNASGRIGYGKGQGGLSDVFLRNPQIGKNHFFHSWQQNHTYSPSQTALYLLQSLLPKEATWSACILLLEIGSECLDHLAADTRELIWRSAWKQSSHLRQQAIGAFSADRITQLLIGNPNEGARRRKPPAANMLAITRELSAIPLILDELRPGFRAFQCDELGDYGPFPELTQFLRPAYERDLAIFIPQLLHDGVTPLRYPLWPNYDPGNASSSQFGDASNRDSWSKPPAAMRSVIQGWCKLAPELRRLRSPYHLIETVELPEKSSGVADRSLIHRGYVELSAKAPKLPAFAAVSHPDDFSHPAIVVAVQHLLEEAACMFEELCERRVVSPNQIWICGKPYSSNPRIAQRLRLMGMHVLIPEDSWESGNFDSWFEQQVADWLRKAIDALPERRESPILLLDDGGSLIKAANAIHYPGGYRGVEQTSRGNRVAFSANFPVVLVSCSALKTIVEPEFVARAAIMKLARYFPEVLNRNDIGLIGLGALGHYFAKYLINRPDIGVNRITVFDRDSGKMDDLPTDGQFVRSQCDENGKLPQMEKCGVVFGCTGTDISPYFPTLAGKLFISLSSSDLEFAGLIGSVNGVSSRNYANMLDTINVGGYRIAAGGFPITFDRSVSSGSLIEWQLTRALLLTAVYQALEPPVPESTGGQPLCTVRQWKIWEQWKRHVCPLGAWDSPIVAVRQALEPRWPVSLEPAFVDWWNQRVSEELGAAGNLGEQVGNEKALKDANTGCFASAKLAASKPQ